MPTMMLARLVSVSFVLALGACATVGSGPKNCRQRAQSEYRRCVNPTWKQPDQPVQPTRSQESQACQASYQQAIDACGGGEPQAPIPDLTVTSSTAP